MNEKSPVINLCNLMATPEGWGRAQGREVYARLLDFVEANPGFSVFRVSFENVKRVDFSFASETLVELARRYRGRKGFCFVEPVDPDMLENWEAAAARKSQPFILWKGDVGRPIGMSPTQGTSAALTFALEREATRAAEFAASVTGMSIANASMKFKQLWEQGFLLRREDIADSGGVEFVYFRIK